MPSTLVVSRTHRITLAPKILCLGDSITHGNGSDSTGGYRGPLFATLTSGFQSTGIYSANPLTTYLGRAEFNNHGGLPGQTTNGLLTTVPQMIAQVGPPDIVLCHIGTNDSYLPVTILPNITTVYGYFLAVNPNVRFIIANPLINPSTSGPASLTDWAALTPLVASTIAPFTNAIACPMPFLPDSDMFDNLHPVLSGYQKMKAAWVATLASLGYH